MSSIKLLVLLLLLSATPVWAEGVLTPEAGSVSGLPALGSEGDCLLVSGGVASWGACPGAGAGAPEAATYIVQTADGTLSAEQALAALATGCASITTTTGVVATRTITGTANQITVTNGNCSGNPTLSIPTNPTLPGTTTGTFSGNLTGNVTGNADTATTASTATALGANGANCAAGQFPLGVDASGAVETCTALPTTIAGTSNEIAASAPTGAVTLSLPAAVDLSGKTLEIPHSNTLPVTCTVGELYKDDDAISGGQLYACESTDIWVLQGAGAAEVDTLQSVFARDKEITGANSLANAFRFGDGVTPWCGYTDASDGPVLTPCTDANTRTRIPTNFTWALYDVEGAAAIETVDPDAATQIGKWSYGTAYRPLKSIWFGAGSLSTDGTQCAAPAEATINSGPKLWTIICTDNDGSTIYGSIRMPDSWDGGTVTFTHVYLQTAANTSPLNGDIAAQCRGNGEAPSSTWGTEVAIDDAGVTGSNQNDMTTSAAVTPAGTCAAGDMLYWRYQLDATGTTTAVATLHHLGFTMEYSITSRSD